jgi:LPXTG-site transpeptidase (sortase) family protein
MITTTRRSCHPTLVAATLLALLLTGCAKPPGGTEPAREPTPTQTTETQPGLPRSEPTTVDIPRIGAHSSLIALGLNHDQTVQVPPVNTPMQAGWYQYGPTPGEIGPAVILGHIDGTKQPGIFYRLRELTAGDQILIGRKDGRTITFHVQRTEQVSKTTFPTDEVYANTSDPELRLITCGGIFDRSTHNYRDNLIVYATMLP